MPNQNPAKIPHEDLVSYALGELSEEKQQRVEVAIFSDPTLMKQLEEIKAVIQVTHNEQIQVPKAEDALLRFKQRQQEKHNRRMPVWRIAAAVAGLLALVTLGMLLLEPSAEILALSSTNEIETYTLPDGSHITLSPGSQILYSADFDEDRQIELVSGKAFFDVVKNPELPFRVEANGAEVLVLGTRFDVALNDDETIVKLQEGAVQFTKHNEQVILKPFEKAVASNGRLKKTPFQENREFAWIEHQIIFTGESLDQVVAVLEDHFNQRITIAQSVASCTLEGNFGGESLEEILDLVAVTINGKVTQTSTGILIDGPGC